MNNFDKEILLMTISSIKAIDKYEVSVIFDMVSKTFSYCQCIYALSTLRWLKYLVI